MTRSRHFLNLVIVLGFVMGCVSPPSPAHAASAPVATPRVSALTSTPIPTPIPTVMPNADGTRSDGTPVGTPTDTPTPTSNPATSVQIGTGPFAFSVDLGDWIAKLLAGTWKALGVDGIKGFGDDIAGWLLRNPDLATSAGQMGNVQRMADALRLASVSVCIALFVAGVYRVWLGGEASPVASLGRLGLVLFALGFYKPLAGWLVSGTNAVTDGVLHAGTNATPTGFGAILAAIPGTSPVWALAGVIALLFLFVLGVVRLLGYAFLLVAYVLGPVLLPLGLVPEAAGYTALWAKHSAKLLLWPVLWATEFRLFDALREGLYLPDAVGHAALAPFAALGMLLVMWKTPLMLHSGSFEQGARSAVRVVRVAAGAATAAFSGGAAAPVAGAGAARGAATGSVNGAGAIGATNTGGMRSSATTTTTSLPIAESGMGNGTAGGASEATTGHLRTVPNSATPTTTRGGQS